MTSTPKTYVLMTVDDSASMRHLRSDTRAGFNGYLEKLREDADGRYRMTVAKFADKYELMANNAKLKDVADLDDSNYLADGWSTSLLDAIGRIITDFEREVTLKDGERVLLVVQTDGLENSSQEFTSVAIRKMIQEREATGRWQCLFLGAGPDAWTQGEGLGFNADSVLRTKATRGGTRSTYEGLVNSTQSYSKGADRSATVAAVQEALKD